MTAVLASGALLAVAAGADEVARTLAEDRVADQLLAWLPAAPEGAAGPRA